MRRIVAWLLIAVRNLLFGLSLGAGLGLMSGAVLDDELPILASGLSTQKDLVILGGFGGAVATLVVALRQTLHWPSWLAFATILIAVIDAQTAGSADQGAVHFGHPWRFGSAAAGTRLLHDVVPADMASDFRGLVLLGDVAVTGLLMAISIAGFESIIRRRVPRFTVMSLLALTMAIGGLITLYRIFPDFGLASRYLLWFGVGFGGVCCWPTLRELSKPTRIVAGISLIGIGSWLTCLEIWGLYQVDFSAPLNRRVAPGTDWLLGLLAGLLAVCLIRPRNSATESTDYVIESSASESESLENCS